MTIESQDIVTLDHHGKLRMGVVLQVGIIPGGAAVAIGYGAAPHADGVRVRPKTRDGRILRLYKPTTFCGSRTLIISVDCIYPTGRKCPKTLFRHLERFLGDAIRNSYKRLDPRKPERAATPKQLTATFGELIKQKS